MIKIKTLKYLILLVISIVILWFIAPTCDCEPYSRQKAITKTCISMSSIDSALGLYKQNKGILPTTEEGLNILIRLKYLNKIPKDGWGSEIVYVQDGQSFRLISLGPDRKEGGNDEDKDIFYKSCKTRKKKKYHDENLRKR